MRRAASTPAFVSLVFFVAVGCGSAPPPPPVAVGGSAADLAALAGEWRGEYWSADTGRRGVIRFQLQADPQAAWGEVWMAPAPQEPGPSGGSSEHPAGMQPLQIRFVRAAAGGALSGSLDPYRDPECDCMLSTVFTGQLGGDRITGTYTSRGGPTHPTTSGQWEARRIAAVPPTSP